MPRGGSNYIPRPDGEFSAFAVHFLQVVDLWWKSHGLDDNDLLPLKAAVEEWSDAYPAHTAAQQAAESARAAKQAAREELERQIRPITNFVQGFPETTDADRANMGITVRESGRPPAPPPRTRPLARVQSGNRLTHRVRFSDEATPTRRGKPPGTLGAEVWLALTPTGEPAPPLGSSYKFLALNSRGSLQADFPSSEAGKTAYYALRWVSTRGDKGPWSEVTAATVAA